jgi:hypothetical protein
MRLLKQVVAVLGSVTMIAVLMAIIAPKTARSTVAAMVQVANTAAAPAITNEVPHLASQTVMLTTQVSITGGVPTNSYLFQLSSNGTQSSSIFIVPSGENFVITSIQFDPTFGSGNSQLSIIEAASGNFYETWKVSLDSSTQFQYPSGLVFRPGTAPFVAFVTGGTANATFSVYVHGYLTAN